MNTYSERIKGHEQAQVKVIKDSESIACELISYATTVITIDSNGWMIIHGLYSKTTIKHIGWFMRERGFTYQLAKQLYKDKMMMNILTGEVKAI